MRDAIYNIMNAIDFNMGVYYPKGGIYEIVKSLVNIGKMSSGEIDKVRTMLL